MDPHGGPNPYPVLSLFCGPGGLDLGFEEAGFLPVLAIDVDPRAVETYNWNRPTNRAAICQDLSRLEPEQVRQFWIERLLSFGFAPDAPFGVIGGPPCQAFSVGNVRKFDDDPRAQLPLAYARLLKVINRDHRVDFFLFENVAGLGGSRHAESLELFKARFREAGFENVNEFYLNAADFGVPQQRKRMFIAGVRESSGLAFRAPSGDPWHHATVRDAIGGLVPAMPHSRKFTPIDRGLHPNHWHMVARSQRLLSGSIEPGSGQARSLRRLRWDSPSWTVAYGHREVHVHPNGDRRLSVLEAMILQGFPVRYELRGTMSDQFRQVSDAVPPPLARALAVAIASMLKEQSTENEQRLHDGVMAVQTEAQ